MKALKVTSFILMILGVLFYLFGIISRIQHWPDGFSGKISGQITLFIGVILYLVYLFRSQKVQK
ncbi:MAG TPA: hypothetical protein VK213_11540 [Bacteroidales bacterium]|nr:hypothetical protein [Bacteroidales bacterium]